MTNCAKTFRSVFLLTLRIVAPTRTSQSDISYKLSGDQSAHCPRFFKTDQDFPAECNAGKTKHRGEGHELEFCRADEDVTLAADSCDKYRKARVS